MKPIPLIAGGVVGIAALWSAGWYGLKAFVVTPEADKAVEQLRAGSLFFSYDERQIAGFPFGYDISYTGVALSDETTQWRFTAPWVELSSGVADIGEIIVALPPESQLTIAAALIGGEAEAEIVFDIASEGLAAVASSNQIEVSAIQVIATQAAAAAPLSDARLQADDLFITNEVEDGAYVGKAEAKTLTYKYNFSFDGGVTGTTSDNTLTDFETTWDVAGAQDGDLAKFIADDGHAMINSQAASYTGEASSAGGPSSAPVQANYEGEGFEVSIEIVDGRAEYSAEAGVMDGVMSYGPFPPGKFQISEVEIGMEMPLKQSDATQPYALTFSLDGVELDEVFWSLLDPGKALDRDAIEFELRLGGDARVLTDFSGPSFGQTPIDVETLRLDAAKFEALGVEVEAEGLLDIRGDARRPDGEVTINVEGALKLMDDLVSAGWISFEDVGVYNALLNTYARQEGDDEFVAVLTSRNGQVSLNGLPLPQ